MGEQPIFTTKAHVFQIDPTTKKNWMPSSSGSVNVSFYYDSNRNTYRVISVDGSKAIINSTLVPNMTFTKTSQKFGQWSDSRANTVYGLGFGTENELNKFSEKFLEVRDLTKQQTASPPVIQSQAHPLSTLNGDGVDGDMPPPQQIINQQPHSVQNTEYMTPVLDRRGGNSNDSNTQLKYENDRLKIALAQSSQNAKKWEVELQTLKNNNARLTTALQESTSNVEEWKKQLAAYKEENARLKKMLIEYEQSQPNQQQEMTKKDKELSDLMGRLNMVDDERRKFQLELEQLRAKSRQMTTLEENNRKMDRELKDLVQENADLNSKLGAVAEELDNFRSSQSGDKEELVKVHEIISQNVSELVIAQNQLARLLNS